MLRRTIGPSVAILTFTISLTIVWALQLIPRLETALVERFFLVDDSNSSVVAPLILDDVEDSNQIYRLLVQQKFKFSDEVKLIVLQGETTGYPFHEDESLNKESGRFATLHQSVKEMMPGVESQTLDDYLARNKTPEPLRVSNLGVNYVIVQQSDLPDAKFDRFWTKFYEKYPNSSGIVFFSNVGFNDRHDQAFVYAGRTCGGLCGEGEYVLLKKVNGGWIIQKEQGLWVS